MTLTTVVILYKNFAQCVIVVLLVSETSSTCSRILTSLDVLFHAKTQEAKRISSQRNKVRYSLDFADQICLQLSSYISVLFHVNSRKASQKLV